MDRLKFQPINKKMKSLFVFLVFCSVAFAANDEPIRPAQVREVSLQNVRPNEGERIASIEVEVTGASFETVHIPNDWSFEVSAPVSGVAVLKGEAAHGAAMPFAPDNFQRFLTLASYAKPNEPATFSIKVKLGLYLYDRKRGESERAIELSSENILLSAPDQISVAAVRKAELIRLSRDLEKAMTQADMNEASSKIAEYWDRRLATVEKKIEIKLTADHRKDFSESKMRWSKLCTSEVSFRAGFSEGGSIQPLIANTSYADMTEHRVNELEAFYETSLSNLVDSR